MALFPTVDLEPIRRRLVARDTVELNRHARQDLIDLMLEVEGLRAEVARLKAELVVDLTRGVEQPASAG